MRTAGPAAIVFIFFVSPRYGQGGRGWNGMGTCTRMSSPPVSGLSSM